MLLGKRSGEKPELYGGCEERQRRARSAGGSIVLVGLKADLEKGED